VALAPKDPPLSKHFSTPNAPASTMFEWLLAT